MGDFVLKAAPLVDGLPITIGGLELQAVDHNAITAIMPFEGNFTVLKAALGAWVEPDEAVETKHGRLIWAGLDQAFLFGSFQNENAACVDITDGWVFMKLRGEKRLKVLERLVPIDLRGANGKVFRTQLGHLMAVIIVCEAHVEIGVMSSFAQTAHHEIVSVMESFGDAK